MRDLWWIPFKRLICSESNKENENKASKTCFCCNEVFSIRKTSKFAKFYCKEDSCDQRDQDSGN